MARWETGEEGCACPQCFFPDHGGALARKGVVPPCLVTKGCRITASTPPTGWPPAVHRLEPERDSRAACRLLGLLPNRGLRTCDDFWNVPERRFGSAQCTVGQFGISVRTTGPMPTGSHRPRPGRSSTAGPYPEAA